MLNVGLSGYQIWYHAIAFAEELLESKLMKIVSVFDEDPKQAKRLGEAAGGAKVFAGYRLMKTAEIAHQSSDLNKQLKISFDI